MARWFEYDGKRYPDPDPSLSVEEVRLGLTNAFPELHNAATGEKKDGEDTVYTFTRRVGTKGAPDILILSVNISGENIMSQPLLEAHGFYREKGKREEIEIKTPITSIGDFVKAFRALFEEESSVH